MITRQMELISDSDVVLTNRLCKGLGCKPVNQLAACSARRNLFGCLEDSSPINELLLQKVAEMAEKSSREWNFDFIAGSPIPGGRYLWERVKAGDIPQWYKGDCDLADENDSDGQSTCSSSSSIGEKENTLLVDMCMDIEESECKKIDIKPRLLQTSIKGYAQVQKRRTSKRLLSKQSDSRFIKGSSRVANYILDASGLCKKT